MTLTGADRTRQIVTVAVGALLALVMGTVLVAGFRLATQLTENIAALQTASLLQTYPAAITQDLTSLRDRLEARTYSGQALTDVRSTVESFERDLQALESGPLRGTPELDQARLLWQQHAPVLDPVVAFTGQPYIDSDEAGSQLSREGRAHHNDVKRAQLFARENAERMHALLAALAATLQEEASAQAARLRLMLSAGVLAALVLAAVAAYLQIGRARHERAAREAQEQTRDILRSVKEGFFLLDADYRIGSVWSDALTRLFGRRDFAGLAFEELLQGMVAPATLATATKYIKLLWGDRAHENLMKSINPLGQLEVSVETPGGGRETRYLQFDFHRVMSGKAVKHVLVSVSDVTSNVLLARELQESQESASSQADMLLGLMHVDPVQLVSFLDATETGLQLINAILKEPARTDAEFRKKLDGLFRELHSIKGEASALNLMSIATRVHTLEDAVSELKKRAELSGNDFLPLVVKLDDLLAHLKTVRDLGTKLTALRESGSAAARPAAGAGAAAQRAGTECRADELSQALHGLADRLAAEHRKRFRLALHGLAEVPTAYRSTVKDVLIQMLRNSAVHGIEPAEVRRAQTKEDTGLVRVEFRRIEAGYELVFEDDGAGMSPEQLKAAAVRRQLVSAEEAAAMDNRTAMALIFKPGFSTQEHVTMDAGRGVGMDVVAKSIYGLGGKIGVRTQPGRFTRFSIVLPAKERESTAVA